MASIRGILNIQSLNELTSENNEGCITHEYTHSFAAHRPAFTRAKP